MATADNLRPQYLAADRAGAIVLRLTGSCGHDRSTARVADTPTGVTVTVLGNPRVSGATSSGDELADAFERLAALLASRGITLHACGACALFRFTSMSAQMSGSEKGYCTIKGIANAGRPEDIVFLLDRCDAFRLRAPDRSWWDDEDDEASHPMERCSAETPVAPLGGPRIQTGGRTVDATAVMEWLSQGRVNVPVLPDSDRRWLHLRAPITPEFDLRDRFRGALVGGAIGDAMGRPNEGRSTEEARERKVRAYRPWHGWSSGPTGTITDDTQMTMWLAESILATAARPAGAPGSEYRNQLVDPDDLAQRFTRERIRGIGKATREFVRNYKDLRKPWYEAGVLSAGNGTAMRAAPVGLVHLGDPYRIYRDSLLQSVVTHRDSMAVAAAACQAYATARVAAAPPGALASLAQRAALCAHLATLLDGLERPGYERRSSQGAASLHARIGIELPRYLEEGRAPFADWHNGAYVLESLPCALWCFLASPEDFEQTLFAAVDAGHDADTVAAMACSVAGAYHGYSGLPQRLVADLEYRDRLVELADGLYALNRRLYGPS